MFNYDPNMTTQEMSKLKHEDDVDWASFCEGELQYDFFDQPYVPTRPKFDKPYRHGFHKMGHPDHGELIQYRVERKYGGSECIEYWYEDGFVDIYHKAVLVAHETGVLVNRTWYQIDWEAGDVLEVRFCDTTDLTQLTTPLTISNDTENSNTLHAESQSESSKSTSVNELHPLLVGEFSENPVDYQWPQLPRGNPGPTMIEQELFPIDFFGEAYVYSNDKDSLDDW